MYNMCLCRSSFVLKIKFSNCLVLFCEIIWNEWVSFCIWCFIKQLNMRYQYDNEFEEEYTGTLWQRKKNFQTHNIMKLQKSLKLFSFTFLLFLSVYFLIIHPPHFLSLYLFTCQCSEWSLRTEIFSNKNFWPLLLKNFYTRQTMSTHGRAWYQKKVMRSVTQSLYGNRIYLLFDGEFNL